MKSRGLAEVGSKVKMSTGQNPSTFASINKAKKSFLWLKKPVPKWNPGKWKHGPKPA